MVYAMRVERRRSMVMSVSSIFRAFASGFRDGISEGMPRSSSSILMCFFGGGEGWRRV